MESIRIGRNTNGNDMEARTASPRSPSESTMEFLLNTSDATALNGTIRLSKLFSQAADEPENTSTKARFICSGSTTLFTIGRITVMESRMAIWADMSAGVGGFCLKKN